MNTGTKHKVKLSKPTGTPMKTPPKQRERLREVVFSKKAQKSLLKVLKDWGKSKPTKRQKKIFEVLQNFGVVGKEYKHHSRLIETLDEIL